MDFSILEESEQLGPLLMRLNDVYEEYKDDMFGTVFSQNRISDVVEDILNEKDINEQEEALVTEILLALIRDAELKLRAALSDRISVIDGAPNKLSLELANDDIIVARPVLENSSALSDDDLVYLINTKDNKHWQSIARRRKLHSAIINKLSDTEDISTFTALLKNFNIRLTNYAGERIAGAAKDEQYLVEGLLGRDELSKAIIMDVYQHVGIALQAQIAQKYGYESHELSEAIHDISAEITAGEEIQNDAKPAAYQKENPSDIISASRSKQTHINPEESIDMSEGLEEAYKVALKYKKSGELSPSLMVRHLRRKQYKSFIAQLAVYSDLDMVLLRDLLRQKYGQALAMICIATDIPKSDFMNMYLLTHALRSNDPLAIQGGISKAMDCFNKTDPNYARELVGNKFCSDDLKN